MANVVMEFAGFGVNFYPNQNFDGSRAFFRVYSVQIRLASRKD